MQEPLVSIVCITYNHESYLRKALDGFLMQETSFPVEIVLAEDCSSDGTRLICEEYAAKYPDRINYIWSEYNVGAVANERRAMAAARGKYIATCEGDDYWTDPLKLQHQVDFMEAHPECSVTWHRYRILNGMTGEIKDDDCGHLFEENGLETVEISTDMFLHRWMTQYLTMVFRKDAMDLSLSEKYHYYRDSHQMYHLLQEGKGYMLNFHGGIYFQTGVGSFTDMDNLRKTQMMANVYKEIWNNTHDIMVHEMYVFTLQHLFSDVCTPRMLSLRLCYAWSIFVETGDVKRLLANLKHLIV